MQNLYILLYKIEDWSDYWKAKQDRFGEFYFVHVWMNCVLQWFYNTHKLLLSLVKEKNWNSDVQLYFYVSKEV